MVFLKVSVFFRVFCMHWYPLPFSQGKPQTEILIWNHSKLSFAHFLIITLISLSSFYIHLGSPAFLVRIQKNINIRNYFNKFNILLAWLSCIQNFLDICKFFANYLTIPSIKLCTYFDAIIFDFC